MSLVVFDEQCHQLLATGMVKSRQKRPTSGLSRSSTPDTFPASIMTAGKRELYRDLVAQFKALLAGEPDRMANAANMAALTRRSGGSKGQPS